MVDSNFDLSGDKWFGEEVARWNKERKRQNPFELVQVLLKTFFIDPTYLA